MAGKHVRTVIKKGLQTYAGVNAQADQRVATSIAHQVIHFFDAVQACILHARADRRAWVLSRKSR